jgi:hypothetical protein
MKTKEEVLKHLKQTGYSKKSAFKILGFLTAKEYTEIGENIEFTSGERTFEDFVNWFNSKEVSKTKLETYKEIVDFLMSNVKEVPSYWLEYLNDDIKDLNMLFSDKKWFDELAQKAAKDIQDSLKRIEIFYHK